MKAPGRLEVLLVSVLLWIAHFLRTDEGQQLLEEFIQEIADIIPDVDVPETPDSGDQSPEVVQAAPGITRPNVAAARANRPTRPSNLGRGKPAVGGDG